MAGPVWGPHLGSAPIRHEFDHIKGKTLLPRPIGAQRRTEKLCGKKKTAWLSLPRDRTLPARKPGIWFGRHFSLPELSLAGAGAALKGAKRPGTFLAVLENS